MDRYSVCLEVRTLKTFTVDALGEVHAIEQARVLAESEDGTAEVLGGHAEIAEPEAA